MRKLFMAALIACSLCGVAPAAIDPNAPPQTYSEFLEAHEQWDRFVHIQSGDKVIIDHAPHESNPFPDKALCVAGLEQDTDTLYRYLAMRGVDITTVDVEVTCEPAGTGS